MGNCFRTSALGGVNPAIEVAGNHQEQQQQHLRPSTILMQDVLENAAELDTADDDEGNVYHAYAAEYQKQFQDIFATPLPDISRAYIVPSHYGSDVDKYEKFQQEFCSMLHKNTLLHAQPDGTSPVVRTPALKAYIVNISKELTNLNPELASLYKSLSKTQQHIDFVYGIISQFNPDDIEFYLFKHRANNEDNPSKLAPSLIRVLDPEWVVSPKTAYKINVAYADCIKLEVT